jgi:hypothetical protein
MHHSTAHARGPAAGRSAFRRYTYVGEGQHAPRNAMVTAAPALNPGWYMYRFIEGCD